MRVLEELLRRILEQLKIANQLKRVELILSVDSDIIDRAMVAKW